MRACSFLIRSDPLAFTKKTANAGDGICAYCNEKVKVAKEIMQKVKVMKPQDGTPIGKLPLKWMDASLKLAELNDMIENPDNYDDSSEEWEEWKEGEAWKEGEEWKEGSEYEYGGPNGGPPEKEESKRIERMAKANGLKVLKVSFDEPEHVVNAYALMEKEHLFDGGRMSTASRTCKFLLNRVVAIYG